MPLDGTPTKTEIDILNEMKVTLSSPKSWCKHKLSTYKTRFFFTTTQYCLLGALNLADHGSSYWGMGQKEQSLETIAASNVHKALCQAIPNPSVFDTVACFNNAKSTTHKDILDLLDKVRNEFVAKSLVTA